MQTKQDSLYFRRKWKFQHQSAIALHFAQQHQRLLREHDEEPLLLHVTAAFSMPSTSIADMRPAALKKQFARLYRHTLTQLLGKQYNRRSKKYLQPIVYFYIDHPSSRRTQATKRRRQTTQQNWHIHSVWCLHPHLSDAFDQVVNYLNNLARDELKHPFQTVHAQVVEIGDVEHVVGYDAKLQEVATQLPADLGFLLLRLSSPLPASALRRRTAASNV